MFFKNMWKLLHILYNTQINNIFLSRDFLARDKNDAKDHKTQTQKLSQEHALE